MLERLLAMKVAAAGDGTLYDARNSCSVLAVVFLLLPPPTDQRSCKSDPSALGGVRGVGTGRYDWTIVLGYSGNCIRFRFI